ncbi:MAG TPA: hypothetical protein VNG53_01055 [Bacteroidia bacterium]|nr:hypothetical protein [Bacteroidia bacterium]
MLEKINRNERFTLISAKKDSKERFDELLKVKKLKAYELFELLLIDYEKNPYKKESESIPVNADDNLFSVPGSEISAGLHAIYKPEYREYFANDASIMQFLLSEVKEKQVTFDLLYKIIEVFDAKMPGLIDKTRDYSKMSVLAKLPGIFIELADKHESGASDDKFLNVFLKLLESYKKTKELKCLKS